jgi:1,5-anhydro-D-fructose reductase (1,5-anhydro-D-mannitol-forming)
VADPLRVGVIGCGRILNAHLRGYERLLEAGEGGVEVVALAARREEDALRFLKPGGPPPRPPVSENPHDPLNASHRYLSDVFPAVQPRVWTDAERMIDEAAIDAVDITASVQAHHPLAVRALRRGLHVMVQKPIAHSVAAAAEMVDAAEKAGVALAVMEDMHWQPSVLAERRLVESGRLGQIEMVLATSVGAAPWSPDGIVAGTPWRHDREAAGGGIAFDLGVHLFQHVRTVCGPIARVYGSVRTFEPVRRGLDGGQIRADVDDAMFCHLELVGGGIGQLALAWAGHGGPTELQGGLVLHGSRGACRDGEVTIDGEAAVALDLPVQGGLRDPFALAYRDFFSAIRTGRQPAYDGVEGMTDLAWAAAVMASAEEGAPRSARDVIERVRSPAAR